MDSNINNENLFYFSLRLFPQMEVETKEIMKREDKLIKKRTTLS